MVKNCPKSSSRASKGHATMTEILEAKPNVSSKTKN